jgi:HK97 family phage portal protein
MALMDLEVVEQIGKTTKANTSHPNYWLLYAQPSPYYNRFEWIQGMVANALLWGNGYSKIVRDKFANAKELKMLPSWEVTVKMTERGKMFYEWSNEGTIEVIMPENMIHLKNIGTSGIVGVSTIQIQRENVANALLMQKHDGEFYANGAKASGVLMTPGNLGTKERSNLEGSFNKASKGKFKTIILEEGVKYQQLTIPQNDAQFLESSKLKRSEWAGVFRVPPYKIGDLTDANYSNMESQDRTFAKDTIVPWTTRFQQEIDRKLFFDNERGKYKSQFNLDDLIKGDIKTRYEVYGLGVQWGLIKPSEGRESEGWEMQNTEAINKFFMNSTMVPVEQLGQQNQNQNAA